MPCFGDWCMGGWGRVDGVSGIGMEDLRGEVLDEDGNSWESCGVGYD